MNLAGLIGVAGAIGVAAFTVMTSSDSPKVFFDEHGIVIVLGGTFAVAFLSFRISRLFDAVRILFRKMFGKQKSDYHGQIRNIVDAANNYRQNPKQALSSLPKNAHPFLVDGMQYIVEFGFGADEVDEILSNALEGKKKRDKQEIKVWHTIARFPPAFGLLGATVGMISLLQTLGDAGAQDRIGPAMATALVATFYGLIAANLIFIPIGENLHELSEEDIVMRKIIKEGVVLIHEKRHPLFIEEYLKSFLPPKYRKTEMSSGATGQQGRNAA